MLYIYIHTYCIYIVPKIYAFVEKIFNFSHIIYKLNTILLGSLE
jgi:hypothetical protein